MSDTDRSGVLRQKVDDAVGDGERFSQTFAPYWELFKAATQGMEIRRFYFRAEVGSSLNGYRLTECDIVAICDGLLIDLEVYDNSYSGVGGNLQFLPLSAVGAVNLYPGGVQGLPDTQNALLTVTIDDNDRYWFAKSEDERRYLMDFAQDLIERIAAG